MSTRATYKFIPDIFTDTTHQPLTFYIHHDGYPSGAALYFNNALETQPSQGLQLLPGLGNDDLAARFMRGNQKAKFTSDHAAHWDTYYQYTCTYSPVNESAAEKKAHIQARTFQAGDLRGEFTKIIYDGFLDDFIKTYKKC